MFGALCLLLILTSSSLAQRRNKKSVTIKQTTVVSNEANRKSIESKILKGIDQHGGSINLIEIGTIESIPALLKVLEDNPPFERNGKKSYICTFSHAVSALRKITKREFSELHDWKSWWETYKNK